MNKEDIRLIIEAFYTVNRRIRTSYDNDMDLCIKYARTDKYLEDILEVYNELKKAEE